MLTAQSRLAIKRSADASYVDLSNQVAGVSGWNDSVTSRSRPIPTIPQTLAIQTFSVKDGNVNFTVDDNSLTHPIMFLRSGEVFDIRVQVEGAGSGKPQAVYTGPMTISLNNAEGGARTFQCSLTVTSLSSTPQS